MKRPYQLGSASLAAWLALVSSALADASAAPQDARQPPIAEANHGDTPSAQLPELSVLRPAPNAVFLEVLGPATVYSVNYERILFSQVAVRVGFAAWWWTTTHGKPNFVAPITLAYVGLAGLEAGGGITLQTERAPMASMLVGYRLHPRGEAGFQFRVGGMVLIGTQLTHLGDFLPWLYVSVGAGF
jgi:hypothetical protein